MINRLVYISIFILYGVTVFGQDNDHQMPDITNFRSGEIYYQESIDNRIMNPNIEISIPHFLPHYAFLLIDSMYLMVLCPHQRAILTALKHVTKTM